MGFGNVANNARSRYVITEILLDEVFGAKDPLESEDSAGNC